MNASKCAFAVSMLLGLVLAPTIVTAQAEPLVLTASRLYVSPDAPAIDNATVIIDSGRISAVGPKASVRPPENAVESKCSGGVVAAGFHNSHIHLTGEQFSNARAKPADALTTAFIQMLTRYGFTTVTDVASDRSNTLALRARISSGEVLGPRILMVGTPLYPPNGVPFYLKETLPKAVLAQLAQPSTPEEAHKVVNANLDAGAEGTKLFIATPQRGGPVKRMPADITAAVVDATHRRGRLAMTHPTDVQGVQAAVTAGIDIVMHTTPGETQAWPMKLVQEVIAKKMSLIPTLQLWPYELKKSALSKDQQDKLITATLLQLRDFASAGGQVLFGTDVGYMTDFDPTVEYELMAKAGLTPMDILNSLTLAPSVRWMEDAHRGRIVAGRDADLVVLADDPARDVRNFAKVRCTIRAGKIIYAK